MHGGTRHSHNGLTGCRGPAPFPAIHAGTPCCARAPHGAGLLVLGIHQVQIRGGGILGFL